MLETQANLLKAIAGESMARNKYDYYADIALKEGHIWIAEVFKETALNERAHAKEELEQVCGQAEMTNTYSIDSLADTLTNLRHAAAGEKYEYTIMYPEFKKKAEEEGNDRAAELFQEISEVEEKHYERFTKLADALEAGDLYNSKEETEWKCLNCGYIHKGKEAPKNCPACKKPQGWYMHLGFVK